MPGIMDFVKIASQTLGQPEDATKGATAALLGGLEARADAADFAQLSDAIPGVKDLLGGASPGGEAAGGGMLGGLMGQAASALGGGDLSSSLGVLAAIQKSGFSASQTGSLVKLLVDFAKSNADEGLVGKILRQVPELARMAG
jgi:uncharacterized protein VcgC/VcgE DUF2780